MCYEFKTVLGRLSVVCDASADPPFRFYGPDGIQVDPSQVIQADGTHGGYAAYDLTEYEKRWWNKRKKENS